MYMSNITLSNGFWEKQSFFLLQYLQRIPKTDHHLTLAP